MVNQRGIALAEALVALALLGLIAGAFLPAISSGMLRGDKVQESYIAQDLARTQLEDLKSLPYADTNSYPVTVSPPGDYTVSIAVIDESPPGYPNSLQRIIVTVARGQRSLLVLESYKAKR